MSNRKELIERQNMKEDTKNIREINYVYIIFEGNEMTVLFFYVIYVHSFLIQRIT